MKKSSVIIERPAQEDIQKAYDWGCRFWGREQANKWVREVRDAIATQPGSFPAKFPLAPESSEFREGIRQLLVGRYRVLYVIRDGKVHVLHVRGAYAAPGSRPAE